MAISFFRRSDTTGANERSNAYPTLFLSDRGVISGSGSGIEGDTEKKRNHRGGAEDAEGRVLNQEYSDLCELGVSLVNDPIQ